jgi:cytochrome c biogenesis protein CcmG, thiol:disulfide interchange protein DsbE
MNNKAAILVVVATVGALFAYSLFSKEDIGTRKAAIGKPAPAFELSDLNGKKISLSSFKDKVVLVNFWATWCDTCKEEKIALQKLLNAEKGNTKLAVLTILFKDTRQNADEYMKKNKFTFDVLIDDTRTSLNYGLTGVPETFIVSKGILTHKMIGPVQWDAPDARAAIKELTTGK